MSPVETLPGATVGVPLWGAALFFAAVAATGMAVHLARLWRSSRRRGAGLVDADDGWFRSASHIHGGRGGYVCAAVRRGGALVEIWSSARPDEPLPPPRDARPFAASDPEKPIGEAIALGLPRDDAHALVTRVLTSAGGT